MKQTTLDAITRYVEGHVPTGDFLRAVLSNDLVDAVCRADDENLEDLPEIVRYIYCELPGICWGSPGKVKAWLATDGKGDLV